MGKGLGEGAWGEGEAGQGPNGGTALWAGGGTVLEQGRRGQSVVCVLVPHRQAMQAGHAGRPAGKPAG